MDKASETTILQEGLVKITNRRLLIGTITYPMAEIRTVRLTKHMRNMRPLWIAAAGTLLVIWSVLDQTGYYAEFFNIGIFLMVIGLSIVLLAKPSYAVQIGDETGTRSILSSTDFRFIQRIVEAMNRAIVLR